MSVQLKTVILRGCLLAALCFPFAGHAQDTAALREKLQQYRKQLDGDVVGVLYKGGKIITRAQLGDLKADAPVPVAACSKWLTAALVMIFVDEGKLSLDDKVSTYLPIFKTYSKGYITIRQCLSHFTGIEDKGGVMNVFKGKYASLDEEVTEFVSKREIQTNPGVEFRYNEMGVDIAARVLEIVGKKPFERLVKDRLFRVLDMKRSSFPTGEHMASPSTGAVCSANDYVLFLSMLLNKGMYNGKRILSEASVAELLKPSTTPAVMKAAPKGTDGFSYGLGAWLQQDDSGKVTVALAPSLAGSWAFIDLERGYAGFILTKNLLGDLKRSVYNDVKQSIDE